MDNTIKFDRTRLTQRIIEECGSVLDFSKEMGMEADTLTNILQNEDYFTADQIEKAAVVLKISSDDISSFFFNTMPTAKKLTLEQLESLPLGAVVWRSTEEINEEGIAWHYVAPVMVYEPGKDGALVGGFANCGYFGSSMADILYDPTISFWNIKPDDWQLIGLSEEEYNAWPVEKMTFFDLAKAITLRKKTLDEVAQLSGVSIKRLVEILTGSQITSEEVFAIADALHLSLEMIEKIFKK